MIAALGVDISRLYTLVFALGAALAGLADLTDGGADAAPLLLTGVAATLPGWLLYRGVSRPHRHQAGDILTGVTTAFLAMVAVGALLYLATGAHGAFDDAVFESAAGFSTTAMTLLDVEELGRGVLLFRAASQWVGGLGALLLGIAILPALSVGRELADRRRGMGRKPLAPSGGTAARNVLGLYGSFTLLMFLGYLVAGVGFIGSLVLAASTVSTGGFVGPGDPLATCCSSWREACCWPGGPTPPDGRSGARRSSHWSRRRPRPGSRATPSVPGPRSPPSSC